jgi:hypothetical protein
MNLVAVSEGKKLLFIASKLQIFVKSIGEPHRELLVLQAKRAENVEELGEPQTINTIETGILNEKEYLVAVDTAGLIHIWECSNLGTEGKVLYAPASAWSIAFTSASLAIGNNAHSASIFSVTSEGYADVENLPLHEHNVPSVAFSKDGRWLASVSIDGTCAICEMRGGSVRRINLEQWGWSVCWMSWEDLERPSDYGELGSKWKANLLEFQFFRHTRGVSFVDRFNIDVLDDDFEDHEDYDGHNEEYEEFIEDHVGSEYFMGGDAYDNDQEVWPVSFNEDAHSTDEDYDATSVEGDPGMLARVRIRRELFSVNDEVNSGGVDDDEVNDEQVNDEEASNEVHDERRLHDGRLHEERFYGEPPRSNYPPPTNLFSTLVFTSKEPLPLGRSGFFAAATNTDLILLDPIDGTILLRMDLGDLIPSSVLHAARLQSNRLCMSQWIPELSLLLLGNQCGCVLAIHLMLLSSGNIQAKVAVLPLTAASERLAGLRAYRMGPDEWELYILYNDGMAVTVRLMRIVDYLDLTNTVL